MWRTRALKGFTAVVTVEAMTLGLAGTANAATAFIDYADFQIRTEGQIDVYNDQVGWSLTAFRGIRQGACAYLQLESRPEQRVRSAFPFSGRLQYSRRATGHELQRGWLLDSDPWRPIARVLAGCELPGDRLRARELNDRCVCPGPARAHTKSQYERWPFRNWANIRVKN